MKHLGAPRLCILPTRPMRPASTFSVLTLTVPSRAAKLARVQAQLHAQRDALPEAERGRVSFEVLLTPPAIREQNRIEHTVGQKRNRLIAACTADYIAFVDDDDLVRPDYLASILGVLSRACDGGIDAPELPDLVTFRVEVHGWQKNGRPKVCHYDPRFLCDRNFEDRYERLPNHVMVWRLEAIRSIPYDERRKGEDSLWANAVRARRIPRIGTHVAIDRVLYEYHYNRNDSVCAGTLR